MNETLNLISNNLVSCQQIVTVKFKSWNASYSKFDDLLRDINNLTDGTRLVQVTITTSEKRILNFK
jgi:hypothetical protein